MIWLLVYLLFIGLTFIISLTTRRWHAPAVRRLSFLLGYMLVKESIAYALYLQGKPHGFLSYFYRPVEYAVISQLYASLFDNRRVVQLIETSNWFYVVLTLVHAGWAWQQGQIYEKPTLLVIVGWLFIIVILLYYFYDLYRSDAIINITRQPVFWISTGNFLFYCGTFFLMGLYAEIRQIDQSLADRLYLINTFLNLLLYTFWSIGFLCVRRSVRSWS
jgi:hypothetical protein